MLDQRMIIEVAAWSVFFAAYGGSMYYMGRTHELGRSFKTLLTFNDGWLKTFSNLDAAVAARKARTDDFIKTVMLGTGGDGNAK